MSCTPSRAGCRRQPRAPWIATLLVVALAAAAPASAQAPDGTWVGSYSCVQGVTALDLSLHSMAGRTVSGVFHFGALPPHAPVPQGCFAVHGSFDPTTGVLALAPTYWLLQPMGYVMVGLQGRIGPDGSTLTGKVRGGFRCGTFLLRRVAVAPARPAACAADAQAVALAAH